MRARFQFAKLQAAGIMAVALCAGVAAAPAAASVNLVVNGYFDNPNPGTVLFSTSLPGWTSNTSDSLETGANGTYGLPSYAGSTTNLELNANTFGSISQTVSGFTVGQRYDLTFGYGVRANSGPQGMDTFVGGESIDAIAASNSDTSYWTPISLLFTATSDSEVLTFSSVETAGNPGLGNELTAVSITAVPEAATWVLMLAGIGGLGAALRGRRRLVAG